MKESKIEDMETHEHGELVAGLDIGTTKICAVIGEVFGERIEVIGVGTAASSGMRKGVVVNIEATVKAVREAVEQAENMAGCEIPMIPNITGYGSEG